MMDNQNLLLMIPALLPLVVGIVWKMGHFPLPQFKALSLATIVASSLALAFIAEIDASTQFIGFAVLLAGFSVILCQEESLEDWGTPSSNMIILGLTLGAVPGQGFVSRLFLCGLLGFAAFTLIRQKQRSFRTTFIIIHFIIAIILSLSSSLGGETLKLFSGLFLAITFLPLAPFHLPFAGTVEGTKGTLSSFWIIVWLAVGLAELNRVYSSLTDEMLFVISLLAIASAFYGSLVALGQTKSNRFVASATVVHISLMWGGLNVFPDFPKWGIAFGIAVAFILGGISLAFSFVRQRYGWQFIGKLPGLASPMPRLGTLMVLLVSFALFLPILPAISGLTVMPTIETSDIGFIQIFLLYFAVWLGGGWFLLQMLHQTAFGTARVGIPYSDLRMTECFSVAVLLLGAGYFGFLY